VDPRGPVTPCKSDKVSKTNRFCAGPYTKTAGSLGKPDAIGTLLIDIVF
jgi:hypothetical protein